MQLDFGGGQRSVVDGDVVDLAVEEVLPVRTPIGVLGRADAEGHRGVGRMGGRPTGGQGPVDVHAQRRPVAGVGQVRPGVGVDGGAGEDVVVGAVPHPDLPLVAGVGPDPRAARRHAVVVPGRGDRPVVAGATGRGGPRLHGQLGGVEAGRVRLRHVVVDPVEGTAVSASPARAPGWARVGPLV